MPDLADPPFTCFACRFWSMLPHFPDQGRCRRHTPAGHPTTGSQWPVTEGYDWCGEGVAVGQRHLAARHEARETASLSPMLASFDDTPASAT